MYHLNRATPLLAAFTVAGFLVATAAQAAVVNGTFDTLVPSNGTGGGWTSSNVDVNGGWKSTGGNPGTGPFFILNDSGGGTDPTILQVLTGLTSGATYHASGDYRNALNVQSTVGTHAFGVAIDGVFLFEAPGTGNPNWLSFGFDFVPAANSVTLSFAGERNGTDVDFGIDNISVIAAIPEPSTYALMLAGLGFVGFVASRRRKTLAA